MNAFLCWILRAPLWWHGKQFFKHHLRILLHWKHTRVARLTDALGLDGPQNGLLSSTQKRSSMLEFSRNFKQLSCAAPTAAIFSIDARPCGCAAPGDQGKTSQAAEAVRGCGEDEAKSGGVLFQGWKLLVRCKTKRKTWWILVLWRKTWRSFSKFEAHWWSLGGLFQRSMNADLRFFKLGPSVLCRSKGKVAQRNALRLNDQSTFRIWKHQCFEGWS